MFGYFDIGGTKTRVAVSADGTTLSDPVKFDTPQDFEQGIATIADALHALAPGAVFSAVGGGVAGPLDPTRTTLVHAPHLPEWIGKPLAARLSESVGVSEVYIENDSAIVGLGEAHHGAGRGDEIMAYITISTGVGGVRIVDGKIDRARFGFEPGHQILAMDRAHYPRAPLDEAEELLSGTAIEKRFGKKPYEIADPQLWEELSIVVAYLLNNIAVLWSPDSIVLGGSMVVGDPAIPVDRIRAHLEQVLTIFPTKPLIKMAQLRDMGGIYGAQVFVTGAYNKNT